MVFPSYFFLPYHFTGIKYDGHKKVYAHQEWCNTGDKYATINQASLPVDLQHPKTWVSVLVSSYNTKREYIRDCLQSIADQIGHFGMEIVWINDGSTMEMSKILDAELEWFKDTTRFCKVIYKKLDYNCGLSYCLSKGVEMCSHDLIFRMDSDDIMHPERIKRQLEFMDNNADCMISGTQVQFISDQKKKFGRTNHAEIIMLEEFKKTPQNWFMNHPTLCFRKEAIMSIGNYNSKQTADWILEDFEMGLKMLKHYGKIYNMPDVLLLYRIHSDQTTKVHNTDSEKNNQLRNQMIRTILF
jgi:glycosyltransferase involved in cell wall biosynthesis